MIMEGFFYSYYVPKEAYHVKPLQTASPAAAARRKISVDAANNNLNNQHNSNTSPDQSPHRVRSSHHLHRHRHHHQQPDGIHPDKDSGDGDSLSEASGLRSDNYGMDGTRATSSSMSSSGSPSIASSNTREENISLLANPFELRHGRRYLRDLPYPLPCDLAETQRQNMRTMLGTTVFGRAVCAPAVIKNLPKKVLEIGCGAAYWSSSCQEWLANEHGHTDVAFTGVDIAPLSPDLSRQGMNWRFVQHDLRRLPWPFEDEEFDLIMVKDMSLAVQIGMPTQQFMDETIRILAEGGTLEYWESDHILRCLRPHPPAPPRMLKPEEEMAVETKTYLISPSTPFAPAQNKYAANWNAWISDALDDLKLTPAPCSRLLNMLYQEADTLSDVGFRRVAVPLSELRWERENIEDHKHARSRSDGKPFRSPKGKGKADDPLSTLTPAQAALRYTALLTVLQKIESLEPLLKEVCGKNSEEWSRWWASMMASFLDQENSTSGEVLEIGAWWATKRTQT